MDPHSQNEGLTNMINGQVYERLTSRDRNLKLVPGLATEWQQVSPLVWRAKLRPGVKFHDGAPITADDVVFSVLRAQQPTSQINNYAAGVGMPVKIDDLTVEFRLKAVNPIFLEHLDSLWIMSKAWCEKNKAEKPLDFKNKEELYTSLHANGTGPYMLVSRAPGIKTVYKRNPNYWGKVDGNVAGRRLHADRQRRDAARRAGLGRDRLRPRPGAARRRQAAQTPGVKVIDGPENRIVFIAFDQGRDELLYSSVKGKNPFKDVRVRKALYQAIDIQTLKTKLMQGQSYPTGGMTPSPAGAYDDPALEARLPYDPAAAKKLLADAGYPDGFEVQLNCPNNRYVNDEQICIALAGMWAQVKVKVKVAAEPRDDLLPAPREVRLQHVHARLGRRLDRRRAGADAGDAQLRAARRASASTTTATPGTTSSTRWRRSRASSPTRRSARSWSRRRCASKRNRSRRCRCIAR